MQQEHFYFTYRQISSLLVDELKRLKEVKKKHKKILDIGCGDGVMVFDLQRMKIFDSDHLVTGIDISPKNIDVAKKRIKNVRFRVADASRLPFKGRSFDFVYSWMVLEHQIDPIKMINEISRVMKKDAKCYISTIMKNRGAIYFYRRNKEFVLDPTHVSEFKSVDDFSKLIKNAGLKVIKLKKTQRYYSILELVLKVLIRLNMIHPKVEMRDVFGEHHFINFIRSILVIAVPGFYQLEAVCELDCKS